MIFLIQLVLTIWAAVRFGRWTILLFIPALFVAGFILGGFLGVTSSSEWVLIERINFWGPVLEYGYIGFMIAFLFLPRESVRARLP